MDYAALAAWLDSARPDWRTEDPATVATWANAPTATRPVEHRVTDRIVYDLFGPVRGEAILTALEAAAAGDAVAARVWGWLQGAGVDVGSQAAPGLLAGWVAAGLLTQAEADEIATLGQRAVSPAQLAGIGRTRAPDIIRAKG